MIMLRGFSVGTWMNIESFMNEDDFILLKSMGVNVLRLALGHKHFEDDRSPVSIFRKDLSI